MHTKCAEFCISPWEHELSHALLARLTLASRGQRNNANKQRAASYAVHCQGELVQHDPKVRQGRDHLDEY